MVFSLLNLPYWIILAIGVMLYVMVIVTGGGDDGADADADVDVDADADAEIHGVMDADADAEGDFSVLAFLGWLGFGKAPLILLLATDLSLLGVMGWLLNVVAGQVFGFIPMGWWSGVIFGFALTIALFLGSLIARPLGRVFAQFGEDTSSDRLIGCVGHVSSAIVPTVQDGRIGQINVLDAARNRVSVNAMIPAWATVIPRLGDPVLVIERSDRVYLVVAKDSPDQERWLANAEQ